MANKARYITAVPPLMVARIIRRIRLRIGERQTDFGKRCGVTQTVVSDWENGNRHPGRFALSQVAGIATPSEKKILLEAAQDARPQWTCTGGEVQPSVSSFPEDVSLSPNVSIAPSGEGCNVKGVGNV